MLGELGAIAALLAASAAESRTVEDFILPAAHLLADSPLKVERVFLSLQTLHPAFRARTYIWRRRTDGVEVTGWPHGLENRPGYYDSPDFHVHTTRKEFRVPEPQAIVQPGCDPYQELKAEGYTDYLMVPLLFSDGTVNTLAIATRRPNGFPAAGLDRFRALADTFVIILERYAALETVASTLRTYLGGDTSQKVLRGGIRTGHGEIIDAVVLYADLRDFTALSSKLDEVATVRLLNDYFDCVVGPIERLGGHVLKFIGDAVLAFFAVLRSGEPVRPLDAARAIQDRLARLNQTRRRRGAPGIRHGLCLHFGQVLYGNVGSSSRLDFTIIGQAVNVAARCVEISRDLGVEYLFTRDFVERFGEEGLAPVDVLDLRGIPRPIELFTFAYESNAPGTYPA
jgi:adenylate cyclase